MNLFRTSLLMIFTCTLMGCVSVNAPVRGGTFNFSEESVATTDKTEYSKVGTSECTGILGIAFGDCSIEAAARNGEISEIVRVDGRPFNLFGIFANYTTIVYGN